MGTNNYNTNDENILDANKVQYKVQGANKVQSVICQSNLITL